MTGHEELLKAIRDVLTDVSDLDEVGLILRAATVRATVSMVLDDKEAPDFAAKVMLDMVAKDIARRPPTPLDDLMATVAEIKAERGGERP